MKLVPWIALGAVAALLFWPESRDDRAERRVAGMERRETRPTAPGESVATEIDVSETPPPGEASVEPARKSTWRVFVVGKDGKPARGVSFMIVSGTASVDNQATNEEGALELPAERRTLRRYRDDWIIDRDGEVIRLDSLVPLTLDIMAPELGVSIGSRVAGHVDTHDSWHRRDPSVMPRAPVRWFANTAVSRYARAARGTVVAWKQARIEIVVNGPDGPADDVSVARAFFGGTVVLDDRDVGVEIDTTGGKPLGGVEGLSDARGLLRVSGVPAIPGETLRLLLTKEDLNAFVAIPIEPGAVHRARATLVYMNESSVDEATEEIGLGGIAGARDAGNITYAVSIRALRRDGRPAAHARVRIEAGVVRRRGRTDGEGRARIEGVHPGTYRLSIEEPGILYASRVIRVGRADSDVMIAEPPPWSFRLRVVDDKNRPAAFAAVHVDPAGPLHYVKLVDGVQWLNHTTDQHGEIEIGPLPPGEAGIRVWFGTRTRKVRVDNQPVVVVALPEAQ